MLLQEHGIEMDIVDELRFGGFRIFIMTCNMHSAHCTMLHQTSLFDGLETEDYICGSHLVTIVSRYLVFPSFSVSFDAAFLHI